MRPTKKDNQMTTDLLLAQRAPALAQRMAQAATAFLASLDGEQRAHAGLAFHGDERYQWAYTPGPRNGLLLKDMTTAQRNAALRLFDAGLSARRSDRAADYRSRIDSPRDRAD